MAQEDQVH